MLVDSHCHLDDDDFSDEGVPEIISRAQSAGVGHFLTICTRIVEFDRILKTANISPLIHCTVGTHPHHAEEPAELNVTADEIVKYTENPKVAGIGETGLDYHYNNSPAADQQKVFATHIEAGLKADLPVIVHTREANDDTVRVIRDAGGGKSKGVMHCFSGDVNFAKASLDLGYYLSFSGIITFKKADEIRAAVKYAPMERILVETDAPWLAPVPHRGKRNEPSYVALTAQAVAQIKNISVEEVAKKTTENFFSLFGKIKRDVP